jgi:hypothetical protein
LPDYMRGLASYCCHIQHPTPGETPLAVLQRHNNNKTDMRKLKGGSGRISSCIAKLIFPVLPGNIGAWCPIPGRTDGLLADYTRGLASSRLLDHIGRPGALFSYIPLFSPIPLRPGVLFSEDGLLADGAGRGHALLPQPGLDALRVVSMAAGQPLHRLAIAEAVQAHAARAGSVICSG